MNKRAESDGSNLLSFGFSKNKKLKVDSQEQGENAEIVFGKDSEHLDQSDNSDDAMTVTSIKTSIGETNPQALSSNSVESFDVGDVNFLEPLSDEVKKSILTIKYQPEKNWKGPLKEVGDKQRRIPNSMFDCKQYPTMSYSVKVDGIFCTACCVFSNNSPVPFIREPHSDWSNIDRHAKRHIKSFQHLSCAEATKAFLKIVTRQSESVKQQLSKAYADKVRKNQEALEAIVKTLIICGIQNIPIRGKTDERSNFMALIKFRSETDIALRDHLAHAPRNATYISHRVQNELTTICGKEIQNRILDDCRSAKYFSIVMDETTDISVKEQVSLVLVFVSQDGVRHEEFVSFDETQSTTGEALYNHICDKLGEFHLDKNNVVGLGFDGAANMSGKVKGVQARFSIDVPSAQYVHCRAHNLNLAIVHSCKEPEVRNMYAIVSSIVSFIGASAKRLNVYFEVDDNADRLKKFCATRWTCHEETLGTFLSNIDTVVDTLDLLASDGDPDTSSKAASFKASVLNFSFIMCITVVRHYLAYTKPVSLALQSVGCDLHKAMNESKMLLQLLKNKRNNDDSVNSLLEQASSVADDLQVQITVPRQAKRQTHRLNAPSECVVDHYKYNMHNPFLDHLINETEERLCSPGSMKRVKAQMLLPYFLKDLSVEDINDIKESYKSFINCEDLDVELERWQAREFEGDEVVSKCITIARDMYPNIEIVLRIFLTMPVSVASAERSFSALKRLKSYLRSTMGSERLSALALLHIHPDMAPTPKAVVEKFDSSGHRRISLAFD